MAEFEVSKNRHIVSDRNDRLDIGIWRSDSINVPFYRGLLV